MVDEQVVYQREQPGAQVAVWPPQIELAQGALQRVLHQVVGQGGIPHQRPCIAAQRRDMFDQIRVRQGSGTRGVPHVVDAVAGGVAGATSQQGDASGGDQRVDFPG